MAAGTVVGGRYELERLIGKGGIGEVWCARHTALNSRVAIKFLQLASAQKESAKRRFTTEAQVTAQLKTPNAVQVFDFGVTDVGQPYLVMELLEGETLGRRLERLKQLSPVDTALILGQAARALTRAHQLGIVHRDFKPDNIVICPDDEGRDQVKVLDFGVAKIVGVLDAEAEDRAEAAQASPASFTRTGAVLGTPLYMAPEQALDAANVDLRADIWAFGVVAFECLTGRPPFMAETIEQLFQRILNGTHPSARLLRESVPEGFDSWFDLACAPDPDKRFSNAGVAWKQLAVALDIRGDFSSGGYLAPPVDRERPVVVVPDHDDRADDPSGPTVDVQSDKPPPLVSRSQGGDFASLRRIQIAAHLPADASSAPAASPMAQSVREEKEKARSAVPLLGLAVALVALGGLAVWRTSGSAPRATPAADGAGARSTSAPAPTPIEAVPSLSATGSAAPVAADASASASSFPAARGPGRPAGKAVTSNTAATTGDSQVAPAPATPAPAAPPATTPPPQPPPTLDPGSYR